jgi:hypothetical protein
MSKHITVVFIIVSMLMTSAISCAQNKSMPLSEHPTEEEITTDEQAILHLLESESLGVQEKDIDLLSTLWSEDAWVADAKHTPRDASDDTLWEGIDAVLNRYVTLVFPGNPSQAGHPDVKITILGDEAVATSSTQIGGEYAPAGDRWRFIRIGERWYIQSLTYNLEPEQK